MHSWNCLSHHRQDNYQLQEANQQSHLEGGVGHSIWQGDKRISAMRPADGQKSSDTIFFLTTEEVKKIPKEKRVTYTRIVVDYQSSRADPNSVRITAGTNLINYPDEVTALTTDIITAKKLWNSVVSTRGATFMCLDVKISILIHLLTGTNILNFLSRFYLSIYYNNISC